MGTAGHHSMTRLLGGRATSLSTAVAWLSVPWRDLSLALALIAAAAAPAFLITMRGVWEDAAGNEIAVKLVGSGPASDRAITVESPAFFQDRLVQDADRVVRAALDEADGYGPTLRTLLTIPSGRSEMLRVDRSTNPDRSMPGDPLDVAIRIMHHPNALGAITVVDQLDPATPGVWISEWLAAQEGLAVGDELVSGECDEPMADQPCVAVLPAAPITVVGIYRTLWDTRRSTDSYGVIPGLDPAILPRWVIPFGRPNYALLLATDGLLEALQIPGSARWVIEMDRPITGTDDLVRRVRSFRSLESSLLNTRSIADPLAQLGGGAGLATATTTLTSTLGATRRAQATLDQPFDSAATAGIALGLGAMAAGAAFSVSRRSKEFRLLAGEGDRWPDFARRAGGQLTAPTILGTGFGIGAALLVGDLGAASPSAADDRVDSVASVSLASVDLQLVVIVAVAGIAVGAAVTGVLGERALGDRRSLSTPEAGAALLAILVSVAGLLWVQVGPGDDRGARLPPSVDVAVVAFPLVGLVAAVGVSMVLLRFVVRRLDAVTGRLSPVPLLTWRRIRNRDGGGQLVMGAMAVALGLAVFTTSLVNSLESAVELKLATELGSATMVELIGPYPDDTTLPEATTMVGLEQSRTQPGDIPVQIVAIDPVTFADAVSWPAEYPISVDEAVDLLSNELGDAVPVIALDGQILNPRGVFGLLDPVRYEVVGTVPSIPLASSTRASLLVASDRIDAFVAAQDEQLGVVGSAPSQRYRRRLLSRQSVEAVQGFVDDAGLSLVAVATSTERQADAAFVAPRYTFGYLRWFSVIAVLGSAIALLFYLSSRRAGRALSWIMLRRMGLSSNRAALISSLEVLVITIVGVATSLAIGPSIANRLLPRFDPAPDVPPTIEAELPLLGAVGLLAAGASSLAAIVWLVERRAMTRPEGPLLRELE